MLSLDSICINGGTQSRAQLSDSTVAEYADAYTGGAAFPAPVVFFDGSTHWLADGFHRVAGAKRAGIGSLECDVKQGVQRDAVLHSVGANATHGIRRTNADKRRAVEMLLRDEEWGRNSARWIADKCGVGDDLVLDVKRRLQVPESGTCEHPVTGRDGKTYPTRAAQNVKARRTPTKTEAAMSDQDDSVEASEEPTSERKPVRRKAGASELDEKIRALHEDGRTTGEIMISLGVSRMTVQESKRFQGLTAMSANPLDSVTTKVDAHASFLGAMVESWSPRWDRANALQRKELVRSLQAQTKAALILIDRLNKEAVKKRAS